MSVLARSGRVKAVPGSRGSWSLVQVPWSGTGAPTRLGDVVLPDWSASAALSPDGRWLAYIGNTTGSAELWVRRYPTLDGAVRISPNDAAEPVWAKDGRELFYLEDDKLMSVRVGPDTKARFACEAPVMLMEKSFMRGNRRRSTWRPTAGHRYHDGNAARAQILLKREVPIDREERLEVLGNPKLQEFTVAHGRPTQINEALEKLVERIAGFEIVVQRLDWHAGPDKNRSAAEDLRVAVYDWRLVGHGHLQPYIAWLLRPRQVCRTPQTQEGSIERCLSRSS
jgi:hypothetical protein